MRHCTRLAALSAALLLLQPIFGATLDDLVPAPKLRPAEVTRFSSGAVKMGPGDIDEIKSRLAGSNRESLARRLTDKASLGVLATNVQVLSDLAMSPSFKLQEWALNALGERSPIPGSAVSNLLTIATNIQTDEHVRALAARVVTISNPDGRALGALVAQIPKASPEIQVLLIELIGLCGPKAQPVAGELRAHLNSPSGAVQFNALRAIYRIEGATTNPPTSELELGVRLLHAAETGATNAQEVALGVLQNDSLYLHCAALLALARGDADEAATEAILNNVAHDDSFVAQVAANVLQHVELKDSAIPVLGNALTSEQTAVRLQAASALRRFGTTAAVVTNSISTALDRVAQQGATLPEVTALLELVRAIGTQGRALAPALAPLLAEQCLIYSQMPKGDVHHLRAWIFVTMADVGAPREALPAIMDGLANTDDRGGLVFAAAARAAATLGPDAADAVPFLLRPFEDSIAEQFLTFEAFGAHASASGEYTTCELEAMYALQKMGPAAIGALPVLRAFVERPVPALANSARFKRVPHPQKEALKTIAAIEAATTESTR